MTTRKAYTVATLISNPPRFVAILHMILWLEVLARYNFRDRSDVSKSDFAGLNKFYHNIVAKRTAAQAAAAAPVAPVAPAAPAATTYKIGHEGRLSVVSDGNGHYNNEKWGVSITQQKPGCFTVDGTDLTARTLNEIGFAAYLLVNQHLVAERKARQTLEAVNAQHDRITDRIEAAAANLTGRKLSTLINLLDGQDKAITDLETCIDRLHTVAQKLPTNSGLRRSTFARAAQLKLSVQACLTDTDNATAAYNKLADTYNQAAA